MKEKLEWVRTLSRTTREDNIKLAAMTKQLFNIDMCTSCPAAIRQAVIRLKNYYIENYE